MYMPGMVYTDSRYVVQTTGIELEETLFLFCRRLKLVLQTSIHAPSRNCKIFKPWIKVYNILKLDYWGSLAYPIDLKPYRIEHICSIVYVHIDIELFMLWRIHIAFSYLYWTMLIVHICILYCYIYCQYNWIWTYIIINNKVNQFSPPVLVLLNKILIFLQIQ